MPSGSNEYSPTWFEVFLGSVPPTETARETAFIRRLLPNPPFQSILDVCCGDGRHCQSLAAEGYLVTGFDRDSKALDMARRRCPDGRFVQGDVRDLVSLARSYDAVICLWQSFGYFDDATNAQILGQMREVLRSDGRLILDVYNPAFFRQHEGTRTFTRNGREITESKAYAHNRLTVELYYGGGTSPDRFDWRLYGPKDLCDLAERSGFVTIATCTNFDERLSPSQNVPRMQLAFARRA